MEFAYESTTMPRAARFGLRFGLVMAAVTLTAAACNVDDAEIPDGPCQGGICVGGTDAGTNNTNNNADPCANVVCNTPPTQCHQAQGTCNAGTCEYALAPGQACDDSNGCTTGDMCDQAGACAGTPKACNTPPSPMCQDANTSIVYNDQGSCAPATGECNYTQQTVTCTQGDCGSVTAGLCPDPCAGRVCDSPPTSCFAVPGTCNEQTGGCSYAVDPAITTCDDGNICTNNDACQGDGSCFGAQVQCTQPPAAACQNATTLRTYTANGAACNMANGQCDYPFTDTDCGAAGCSNGACNTVCDETTCGDWGLPATPNGTAVRTCGDSTCPTTTNLPNLDLNRFNCQVQPILDATCAYLGCHTTDTPQRRLKTFSVGMKRMAPLLSGTDHDGPVNPSYCNGSIQNWEANCVGRDPIMTAEVTYNFDNARLFALDAMGNPANNELLTQALAGTSQTHASFKPFASTNDVRYQAILNWLNGQTSPANCNGLQIPNVGAADGFNTNGGSCGFCSNPNGARCPGPTPATSSYPCNPNDCVQ